MKYQARLLPRLDQLYTQKKSYQVHKKKIQNIKRSRSLSKKSLCLSKINDNQQDSKSIKSLIYQHTNSLDPSINQSTKDAPLQKHMQTIQQNKPGLSYWLKKMNPHQKRLKQEQIKQNKRIRQKIKNTMSFIVQKNQLTNHQQHYSGMKKMLSRYSVDQNSQKTKLKCEIVLKKINQLEKQKLKMQQSRLMQYEKLQSPKSSAKTNLVFDEKDRLSSFLTKRSKIIPNKINIQSKQSSVSVNENVKKRLNQTSLTRGKVQYQPSKINQLKTTGNLGKQIPNINKSSQRYNRVKTELIQRASTNRLFNNSKLSNLSQQSLKPKINFSNYKMIRVNFEQKRPNSLQRVPSLQQNTFSKPKDTNMTMKNQMQLKKYVATKIKTQNSSFTHLTNKNQQQNKFDYQKKRVQRFIKSKTSLTTKDLPNKKSSETNISSIKNQSQELKQETKNVPIIEQKHQSKLATIQNQISQKLQQKKINQNKINLEQGLSACFATEIQQQ